MAYHFKRKGSVAGEVRRLARERIDRAISALEQAAEGKIEGIHSSRKRFKELRALLKLVQLPMGHCYAAEHRCYRDAGRTLAPLREAQVLWQNWASFVETFPDLTKNPAVQQFRLHLGQRLDACRHDGLPAIRNVLEAMQSARPRINDWPLRDLSFDELIYGLRLTYKHARVSTNRVCDSSDEHLLHQCRKRTRGLWCHTTLLEPTSREVMRAKCAELKCLLDALGKDHDLMILQASICAELTAADDDLVPRLTNRIQRLQSKLRGRVCQIAPSVYSETPKEYTRRLHKQWSFWRGH